MIKINTDHLKELAETMDLIAQHQLDKASQIYYCVVKSVGDNQCTIVFNNKQYTVPYYGGKPTPNKTYAIFLPHNNMNESFVIGDGKDGGTEGEIVPITEGGTGADNAADARTNLGLGDVATENVVPLNKGGTGAKNAAQAAKNLGVLPLGEVVTKIPENADLDNYDLPGVYAVKNNNVARTIANIPQQNGGILRVFSGLGSDITASSTWKHLIQEYITYTGERYQRYGDSGSGTAVTWRSWHQQVLDFEIGDVIKTAAFTSSSFTIAADRYSSIDIPVSLSGFTPIGIVSITGSGNGNASIIEFNLASSTSVRIYARNNTSSAITINYYRVTVLFIKSV